MMFPDFSFRSEGSNKIRTRSLFYEFSYDDPTYALFTIKEMDWQGANGVTYLSLRKLYLSMILTDPTEYEFAQTVFGSWDVWSAIKKSPFIKKDYELWRKEGIVKIKSMAIQAIAEEMRSNSRSSFSAAKLLLEKGWLDKEAASQAKQKLTAKEKEEEDKEALALLSEDADRLGIVKLN